MRILPQALCTRYGLAIGATMAPVVYVLMAMLFVISWPIAKFLDCILGQEHGTFYRRAQLKALVDLHGPQSVPSVDPEASRLTSDEVVIIKGALDMKSKTARDAMLELANVFMIDVDARIDESFMDEVLRRSHSRVPVFEGPKRKIIGQVLIKTLIKLDPSDGTPVRDLLGSSSFRQIPVISDDTPLYDILNFFQRGKSHLCLVENKSTYMSEEKEKEIVGIITLEDVIEELIQEEIVDETDPDPDGVYRGIARQLSNQPRSPYRQPLSIKVGGGRRQDDEIGDSDMCDSDQSPLLPIDHH